MTHYSLFRFVFFYKKQPLPYEMSKRANQMSDFAIILIFFHAVNVLCLIRIYQTFFKKIDLFIWLEKILMWSIRTVNELETGGLKMIKAGKNLFCFSRVRVLP